MSMSMTSNSAAAATPSDISGALINTNAVTFVGGGSAAATSATSATKNIAPIQTAAPVALVIAGVMALAGVVV